MPYRGSRHGASRSSWVSTSTTGTATSRARTRIGAADLAWAFRDPAIQAVFCLQGGYGTPRLVPLLDRAAIGAAPKALCGYSDITTLHLAVQAWAPLPTITFYSNGAAGVGAAEVTELSKGSLHRALFSDEPYGADRPEPRRPVCPDHHRRHRAGTPDRRLPRPGLPDPGDVHRDRHPGEDLVPRGPRRRHL